ncbi:hypothetical protein CRYUN_Cryun07bG0003600 [Craigia yunnanensis]
MEVKILLIFFISFSSILSTALSRSSRSDITWWCNRTPHPEPCKYFMSHGAHRFAPKHMTEFRKIMVRLAFDRALMSEKSVLEFGQSCENWQQKAARRDCLKLFDNTSLQLNLTLQGLETRRRMSCKVFPGWFSRHDSRLLLSSSTKVKAHLVVAKDGSGNFRTVQAALDAAAKRKRTSRFIIYVKRGVYRENIEVANTNYNIMLVGDGMKRTIITSSRSVKTGYTTYSSTAVGIDARGFIARDITFSNTAAVVLQNCSIFARRPFKGQVNIITAQGRGDPYQNTGIAIHNSRILAANDLKPVVRAYRTCLGRPWQKYSRTVVLKTYLDSLVSPAGWSKWGNSNLLLTHCIMGSTRIMDQLLQLNGGMVFM